MDEDEETYLGKPSKKNITYLPSSERYNQMSYRRCGKSGLKLPSITLGLWQNFGDEVPFNSSRELVIGAFDLGITHFDLGNNYGNPPGSSEEVLGKILKKDLKNHRDEVVVSTKAGYDMWLGPYGEWGSKKHLIASLDQSLKRLGVDYVDIFYSHRFDPETPLEESMGALAQIVNQGKALYVGISSYGVEETRRSQDILSNLGVPCTIHQPSYSLLNRWIEEDLLETLDKLGMGCITFTVLEQGLLSGKYLNGIPDGTRMSKKGSLLKPEVFTSEIKNSLINLDEIAQSRNQSLAQMAFSWVLKDSRITSTIMGVRSLDQLKENVKALDNLEFTGEELNKINHYAKDSGITLWPPNC